MDFCVIVVIVRIFKNTWLTRFASKEGIQDSELREIVNNVFGTGQARQQVGVVDLGGGVFKIRIARPGEGKSGGYRVIVFFKIKEDFFSLWFCQVSTEQH